MSSYLIKNEVQAIRPKTWNLIPGKSGRIWLVDAAGGGENIHVEGGPGSEGYGGSVRNFQLTDGMKISLTGPWHSNPDSLFEDTGVDLRYQVRNFVAIGLGVSRTRNPYTTTIEDIVYIDENPVLGQFDRGKKLAQEIADRLDKPVFMYRDSACGSMSGFIHPAGPDGFPKITEEKCLHC